VSFAGSSASLPLPDLIQATAYAGRTCRVSVRGGGGAGELGFERGELVAACFQGDRGDAAVLAMLALDDVDYEMELTAPPDRDVAASWQGLVLESARVRDEAVRQARRNASNPALVLPIPAPAVTGPVRAPSVVGADERAERKRKWLVAVAAAGVTATLIVAAVAIMKVSGSPTATQVVSATAAAAAPAATPVTAPAAARANDDATPISRTVVVKGSDTIGGADGVGPLLAKAYEGEYPGTRVAWEGLGSATAFVGLLDGSADVGASSRSVNATELADAERLGVRLTPYVLGYDGIAVIVHPDAPISGITMPELARVFTGEITTWQQLAGPGAPDASIHVIARPPYSGTHAFFRDKVLGGKDLVKRAQFIEATEDIAVAVAADPTAISFVSMGRVTPAVRALAVSKAPDTTPIAPTRDTIRGGTYPIFRPLLLYVRGLPSPHVAELLRFCIGPAGRALLAEHGLVPGDTPPDTIVAGEHEAAAPMVALRIPFATGQTALDRDARIALAALAVELRAAPRPLTLSGHADAERGGGSNADVARRRVEAVAAFLRTHGVDSRLIRVESAGDAAPVATNTTRAGRDQNRRVDIVVGSSDGAAP
jgi:phosphate transport system substrate-binding protein